MNQFSPSRHLASFCDLTPLSSPQDSTLKRWMQWTCCLSQKRTHPRFLTKQYLHRMNKVDILSQNWKFTHPRPYKTIIALNRRTKWASWIIVFEFTTSRPHNTIPSTDERSGHVEFFKKFTPELPHKTILHRIDKVDMLSQCWKLTHPRSFKPIR
jgi:hypothetical protein